jgi:hypothetical protein
MSDVHPSSASHHLAVIHPTAILHSTQSEKEETVPLPDSISNYLRTHSQELADRILQSFPPLHSIDDPSSPMIGRLLRKPYPAQTVAIMGLVRRWQQARAGAVIVTFTN